MNMIAASSRVAAAALKSAGVAMCSPFGVCPEQSDRIGSDTTPLPPHDEAALKQEFHEGQGCECRLWSRSIWREGRNSAGIHRGFDTADLKAAKPLLEDVRSHSEPLIKRLLSTLTSSSYPHP